MVWIRLFPCFNWFYQTCVLYYIKSYVYKFYHSHQLWFITNWNRRCRAIWFNTELWYLKLFKKKFQLFCLLLFIYFHLLLLLLLYFSLLRFTSCSLCVVCNLTCLVIASASFLTFHQNALWIWLSRFNLFALQLVYLCDSCVCTWYADVDERVFELCC